MLSGQQEVVVEEQGEFRWDCLRRRRVHAGAQRGEARLSESVC